MHITKKIIYLLSLLITLLFFGVHHNVFASEVTVTMDNPDVVQAGSNGTYYIKGTYVDNTPATPLPEDYRLRAVYSLFGGDEFTTGATTSPYNAVFSPITGYDMSYTGKFTITLNGLNPDNLSSLTYYYQIIDTDSVVLHNGDFVATYTPTGITVQDNSQSTYTGSSSTYTLLAPLPIPGIESGTVTIGSNDGPGGANFDFGDYINGLLTFAIGIAGALAVVMIVVGGIQYMSTDNFGEKMEGKGRIKNAVGGMLLLLGAYMILNTLNPNLIDFHFKVNSVQIEAGPIVYISSSDYQLATGNSVPLPAEIEAAVRVADENIDTLEYCDIYAVVQKESGARADAIGHDEIASTSYSHTRFVNSGETFKGVHFSSTTVPEKNDDNPVDPANPGLGLDWRFSHGIGLMQVTFFPNTGYTSWTGRESDGVTGSPKDLLDLTANVTAGAHILNSNLTYCGNIHDAYSRYNSGSCTTNANGKNYADDVIKRRASCLAG